MKGNCSLASRLLVHTICNLICFAAAGLAVFAVNLRVLYDDDFFDNFHHIQGSIGLMINVPFISWLLFLFIYAIIMRNLINSVSKGRNLFDYLYEAISIRSLIEIGTSILISVFLLFIRVNIEPSNGYYYGFEDFCYMWYSYFFLALILVSVSFFPVISYKIRKIHKGKPQSAPLKRFCKECGAQLGGDAIFCRECGTRVSQSTNVSETANS